jgi:hypothetical protein
MRALPHRPTLAAAFALVGLSLLQGCSGALVATAHEAQALALLPDCAYTTVTASFQAAPSPVEGRYVVSDGAAPVCATDFDGLQLLGHRFDAPAPGNTAFPGITPASSDPMPGRGSDPAASDPMPGRGSDPAASDPMPGRGNDPAADDPSDPMPGRGGIGTLHAARELAR